MYLTSEEKFLLNGFKGCKPFNEVNFNETQRTLIEKYHTYVNVDADKNIIRLLNRKDLYECVSKLLGPFKYYTFGSSKFKWLDGFKEKIIFKELET